MVKNWNYKTLISTLTLISFVCILFQLVIILNVGTVSGYEISIYNVYPFYFWVLMEIPLLIPFFVFILAGKQGERYPKMTLVSALISVLILLSIPLFRGYPFYGAGDIYSHLALIKEIIATGYIGSKNPYPLIHIFVCILSTVLSIKPETITLVLRQLFYVLYISAVLMLIKSLKLNAKESYLVLFLSIMPVLEFWLTVDYVMPSTEAFFFVPLVLAVFIKSRTSSKGMQYSILLLILLMMIAFLHPETSIFLFVGFISLFIIFSLFHNRKFYKSTDVLYKLSSNNSLIPAVFIFIITFLWFSSTLIFGSTVNSIYSSFTSNLYPTPVTSLGGGFKTGFLDVLSFTINAYGAPIIYIGLSFLALIGFIKAIYKRNLNLRDVFLYSLFLVFFLTAFVLLRQGTAVGMLVYRPLKYVLLISTVISGIYLAKKFSKTYKSKLNKTIFIIMVLTVFFVVPTISLFNVYASPTTREFNYEPTQADFNAMNFFFNHRDPSKPVLETMLRGYTSRLSDYLLGYKKITWGYPYSLKNLPPSHFGYDSGQKLGTFYNKSQYLIIYPPSEYYYETVYSKYPDLERYVPNDFEKLNKDETVSRVYDSGSINIMVIK